MSKLTAREVRKYLETKTQSELINDIVSFVTKFDGVREFYSAQMGRGFSEELLDKYKAIIRNEFFPARGYGNARLSIARKAVNDYKKLSDNQLGLIDLMLFYVEMGVRFTNEYGDINEAFYISMESMYESALKLIATSGFSGVFQERCHKIVTDTSGIGWGFHDDLGTMYDEMYRE